MCDNLPLIPNKKDAICADVKAVLREVFRASEQLPPLGSEKARGTDQEPWINNYKSECEQLCKQEGDLKEEFARRISKKRPSNLYKLFPLRQREEAPWKLEKGMIGRRDFMPAIEQNAGREESLWVQNILNRSSCQFSSPRQADHQLQTPLEHLCADAWSLQTLSFGSVGPPPVPPTPPEVPHPPLPEYIICVPPQLDFVNFTLGHVHTHQLRFVNVSKFEVRLSIAPPRRRELDIELCGTRGLTVTSGSAAEVKVHFRPRDVRTLREKLRVRVSLGKNLVVPIACYMQPPVLHIIVPSIKYALSYSLDNIPCEDLDRREDVLDLGTRLLGDAHATPLLLECAADHVMFFLMTEDSWINLTLEELTSDGSLCTGPFTFHPAWWGGGGVTRGLARCRAPAAGLHTAALRLLASTAATRTLHVLADSVYYTPKHISIKAHPKDYDICSQDDPDCEYYVHLGTAFPNRSLSATIQLINHSPVPYSFYWRDRPWGACSCWQDELGSQASMVGEDGDSGRLCPGAREARAKAGQVSEEPSSGQAARAEPAAGAVGARAACDVRVVVPDAGARCGTQRAVLLLILKDIPKDSFPKGLDPMIMKTKSIEVQVALGKSWSKEICEVVCAQMEVWWEVVPVRFVLDPPVLSLPHSRRVTSVPLSLRATQLSGAAAVRARWRRPAPASPAPAPPTLRLTPAPPALRLAPAHSVAATLLLPLPPLPNEYPETDVITLTADTEEWTSTCRVERACATRHPAVAPTRSWLGVVPPKALVSTNLKVINDTLQPIYWWAFPFRWCGESAPSAPCAAPAAGGVAALACPACRERPCTCDMFAPSRGGLARGAAQTVRYEVFAPPWDCAVASLLQLRRTAADAAAVPGGAGGEARAALVAYRVLAPRLALRVLPCRGDTRGACQQCELEGGAVLRPRGALAAGRRACCRLRVANLTPLPTSVQWEAPPEGEDILKVDFLPNDFDIGSYAEITIQVSLCARRACGRRLFVRRARVAHARRPLYLLIDAAIDGVKVIWEVPIGGAEKTDSFVELRASQKEVFPWDTKQKPMTPKECFEAEDRIREERAEGRCKCRHKMVYIPPPNEDAMPLEEGDFRTPEILTEPPPLTRICPCCNKTTPVIPEHEHPYCLQFWNLPLNTVRTRRVRLRNVGAAAACWRAEPRRWPRAPARAGAGADRRAGSARAPGVSVQCAPAAGTCAARSAVHLDVAVLADCWGCYRDQLLLMVEGVEPIVLDVWIEAVGSPLQFALSPAGDAGHDTKYDATMWLSSSDPERTLRARNTSRSQLTVQAYALLEHEYPQDEWPFRLYMRFFDVLPRHCPCLEYHPSDEVLCEQSTTSSSSLPEEMDTGIELFLAADFGTQDYQYYHVEPQVCTMAAGTSAEWKVSLAGGAAAPAPPGLLLLRPAPGDDRGPFWRRGPPPVSRAALRAPARRAALRLAVPELRARLCALDLPHDDVGRIRKRFRVQNTGSAPLALRCAAGAPWSLAPAGRGGCGGCGCGRGRGERVRELDLTLEPWSSTAMCVEVCAAAGAAGAGAAAVWPAGAGAAAGAAGAVVAGVQAPAYDARKLFHSWLDFYDEHSLLQRLPLILEVEFPKILVEPASLNFGFVTDGDTRKTYFTVWHSSLTATISVSTKWEGGSQFKLFPRHLRLAPAARERVYVQYTARWSGAPVPAEGVARVAAAGRAGGWCGAAVPARAEPARDHKFRLPPHDHTDDAHLLPPADD